MDKLGLPPAVPSAVRIALITDSGPRTKNTAVGKLTPRQLTRQRADFRFLRPGNGSEKGEKQQQKEL